MLAMLIKHMNPLKTANPKLSELCVSTNTPADKAEPNPETIAATALQPLILVSPSKRVPAFRFGPRLESLVVTVLLWLVRSKRYDSGWLIVAGQVFFRESELEL